MKRFIPFIITLILFTGTSCKKEVDGRTDHIAPLAPMNPDVLAGTWKPVLLSAPDEFPLPAPGSSSAAAYTTEINEIRSWQFDMSRGMKDQIAFWGAGAVLRWNEILRSLVAKYNLPPYQNPDGTYPLPDASNPLAATKFPFANPPYAARAYAYTSAAMYDALIAVWHYKRLYNRAAPYKVNSSVKTYLPPSQLPSYPSEDAAVIGVMTELLKLLFPGEQAYIQQLATEHRNARIAAGMNVRSDIDAGEALGKLVAQKYAARARTDGTGASAGIVNGVNLWQEFEANAVSRGEIPWISQEVPQRPPMLPYFGRVKTWLFDSATLISIRPVPPPSTKSEQFKKETEEVLWYSRNATRERIRIVHFWADGVGTYTPPGHWNTIAAEDFIKQNFSEVRWARNMALLNMGLMDAAIACWDAKYLYYNPRPSQVNPSIKTLTGLPNFPAYTSGHSTFSGLAATILGHILPSRKTAYEQMAQEASLSRLYGAIHYRSDCEQGLLCGKRVGSFAITRARTDGAE